MAADRTTDSFTIHEAKTNLSRINERVERGEEIVISRAGTPVAKVIPLEPRTRRTARGSLPGRIDLSGDWDSAATNAVIARDVGLGTRAGGPQASSEGLTSASRDIDVQRYDVDLLRL